MIDWRLTWSCVTSRTVRNSGRFLNGLERPKLPLLGLDSEFRRRDGGGGSLKISDPGSTASLVWIQPLRSAICTVACNLARRKRHLQIRIQMHDRAD